MSFSAANSKKQGDVGLGSAIGYFTSINWTVCVPLSDSQNYDLIVDDGNALHKVQVKTTSQVAPSGNYIVSLRTLGGNQSWTGTSSKLDKSQVSLLFVLSDTGSRWLVSTTEFAAESQVTLRDDWLV